MLKIAIVFFLLVASCTTGQKVTGGCPPKHPFASRDGKICCNIHELTQGSECIFGQGVLCPTAIGCRSVERESCYLNNILIETGVPSKRLKNRCRDILGHHPKFEARTILEIFIGSFSWYQKGGCSYSKNGFWGCISSINSEVEKLRENIDYRNPLVLSALKRGPPKILIEFMIG